MTRAERLSAAAERWYLRAASQNWPRRMNRLTGRLWCLRHAKRCTFLALRAHRQARSGSPQGAA